MHTPQTRPELVIVAGLPAHAVTEVADTLLAASPGVAVVQHDLRQLAQGVLNRRIRPGARDRVAAVELAHGCVSRT